MSVADEALYDAKRAGRNLVKVHRVGNDTVPQRNSEPDTATRTYRKPALPRTIRRGFGREGVVDGR